MNYWVIQVYKGELRAIGPYKSENACRNRYEKVQGGEIHEFRSEASEPKEALQEFRDDRLRD